jgi:hypothetical protein
MMMRTYDIDVALKRAAAASAIEPMPANEFNIPYRCICDIHPAAESAEFQLYRS